MGTVRVFNHHVHVAFYWLALTEFALFVIAFYSGSWLYYGGGEKFTDYYADILPQSTIFAFVGLASMAAMGLYRPLLREGASGVILRLMGAFVALILAMALVFYLLPHLHLWRGIFAQTIFMAFIFSLGSRLTFRLLVDREQLKTRVLVLGAGQRAKTMTNALRRSSDRRGFRFVGFVHIDDENHYIDSEQILFMTEPLHEFAKRENVDRIVLAPDDRRGGIPIEDLLMCRLAGVDVLEVADFFEREAGKLMLDFISPGWLVFSEGFQTSNFAEVIKRGFDITAASLLLLVSWPLILVAILAIWLEDGFTAPIVYRQDRVGEGGKVFKVLKLRSMSVNAEGDGKARWASVNDSRVTRVGGVIRRLRIDELPQIINVLSGDMALVGPRPERPQFVETLAERIPQFRLRHQVKPGIAGWAQLNYPYGASENDARQKLQFDLYYVKNHSLFLDFMILLTTVEIVLFGNGAR